MTSSLVGAVQRNPGQPSSVRIGTVTGVNPLRVSVQGAVFNDVGTIGNLIPVVGMAVVLLGQSNNSGTDPTSWLVVGPAGAPFTGPVTQIPSPYPPGPGNPPMARMRQTAVQSVPNNTSTAIVFNVADVDTMGGWNNTTTYQAVVAGRYQCSGGMSFAANATGVRTVQWAVNGVDVLGSGVLIPASAAATQRISVRTELLYLAVGDTLTLTAFQNSGGALNTAVIGVEQASMNVLWVSHA